LTGGGFEAKRKVSEKEIKEIKPTKNKNNQTNK